jgi:hypothetical protein
MVLAHDDGADGYLSSLEGGLRLVERPLHVEFVFFPLIFHNRLQI